MDQQGFYKQLDAAEKKLLGKWDKWIEKAFTSIPWREYERLQQLGGPQILNEPPAPIINNPAALARILSNHAAEMVMAGQAHAQLLVAELHRQYKKKKLAEYPGFEFDYNENPKVLPEKAIKAMETRSVYLAGDVDGSLFAEIKKIMNRFLTGASRQEAENEVEVLLNSTQKRASLITTTETTYSYNRGRLVGYSENMVDYVRFSAIMDSRTSPICKSRHGLLMAMTDKRLNDNTPPLHGRCRSVLDPVYSAYQPDLISNANLNWDNTVALPQGWNAK